MNTSTPIKMRIEAFGEYAFSLLVEEYDKRSAIYIGDKEFLPVSVWRKTDGEETTQVNLDIMQVIHSNKGITDEACDKRSPAEQVLRNN